MKSSPRILSCRHRAAFTLIELLTVIAIIAILAGILIPTVTTSISNVKKAKTLVQLNNYVTMCRMYKSQYHVWPTLSQTPNAANDTAFSLKQNAPRFVHIMKGEPDSNDLVYNKLKIPFATFGEAELTSDISTVTPVDAFGNDDLDLVFNTNLASIGQISPSVVNGIFMVTSENKTISVTQNPNTPINADVVGLSPGAGFSNTDAVTTWTLVP